MTDWMMALAGVSRYAPVLPAQWVSQWWLALAWGVVLGALIAASVLWFKPAWAGRKRLPCLALLLAWGACALPGGYSPLYVLGLSFQAPGLVAVGWAVWVLWRSALAQPHRVLALSPGLRVQWVAAIVVGWLLLLDTFALLPFSMYAMGFTPWLSAAIAFLVAFTVLMPGNDVRDFRLWIAPAALVLFIGLRLPSGNLWDALLGPGLWLGLQIAWLTAYRQRRRAISRA
jgi:hypothetical protein